MEHGSQGLKWAGARRGSAPAPHFWAPPPLFPKGPGGARAPAGPGPPGPAGARGLCGWWGRFAVLHGRQTKSKLEEHATQTAYVVN